MSKFQPGNKLSKGRPKGSRNKLSEDFIEALSNDFAAHGKEVVEKVRIDRPSEYLKVCAGLLPRDVRVQHSVLEDLESMTDQELYELAQRLHRELAASDGASSGSETAH